MKAAILTLGVALMLLSPVLAGATFTTAIHLATGRVLTADQLAQALDTSRVVVVGEHHTNRQHHLAQRQVIDLLKQSGRDVAVGLEMFRAEAQAALDDWVAGTMDEKTFADRFMDNWGYEWAAYRPIFILAQEARIPLIGLNVSREITRQVFYHGFDSLTSAQKGRLRNISCEIDGSYREFVRRSYGGSEGAHGGAHGGSNFEYFCQAQLVWDSIMAVHALEYLNRRPNAVMVVLAGAGHARNPGIPAQIRKRSDVAVTVLMPMAPGVIDRTTLGPYDADYLLVIP